MSRTARSVLFSAAAIAVVAALSAGLPWAVTHFTRSPTADLPRPQQVIWNDPVVPRNS